MNTQLIQQLQTVQKYISTLFDSLHQIKIGQKGSSSRYGQYQIDINQLLQQNIQYGRKIIELSDKFTAKYRKDHFVDRKDIQEKIVLIYRHVCPQAFCNSLDEMVTAILKKLQQGNLLIYSTSSHQGLGLGSRSSYNLQPGQLSGQTSQNFNSRANSNQYPNKESKIEYYRDEADKNNILSQPIRGANTFHNSKQAMVRSKLEIQNLPLQPQSSSQFDLNINQQVNDQQIKRKRSTNKSKLLKKHKQQEKETNFNNVNNMTTKNVLQIKNFFEQQQTQLRKILQKLSTSLSSQSVKISQQNRQYTKIINQTQKDNIKDFIHANVQNSKHNLNKIYELINLMQEQFEKRSKVDGLVHGRFGVYVEEINKREEIFSFTVSKILQNISILKDYLESKEDLLRADSRIAYGTGDEYQGTPKSSQRSGNKQLNPLKTIQTLQQIANNFYDLYPSHSILKDLKVQPTSGLSTHQGSQNDHIASSNINKNKQFIKFQYNQRQLEKIGYKNEGVQVCLGFYKNQKSIQREIADSKRSLLELFKTQTKVNQILQKFQRVNKTKKNIEFKEVEKLVEAVRDSFTKKNVLNNQNINIVAQGQKFQQQLKKIIETNQKNQKQLTDQYNKRSKKYQKQIQQLQKTIQQIISQHRKQQQKLQSNSRKLSKKLQNQKQQMKKMLSHKNSLQKNIKQMSTQISRLQRQITQHSQKFQQLQQTYKSNFQSQQKQVQSQQQQLHSLTALMCTQKQKHQQQCQIYHQKIIFLETQEQTKIQEYMELQKELEEMIKENKVLKKQVQELTEVYEDKIKELEEVIADVKGLEDELKRKEVTNLELREKARIHTQSIDSLQRENKQCIKELQRLEEKCREKQQQSQKYKQMGVLNEADINILRQQMDKVKQAYIQSEQQLQQIRIELEKIQSQKQYLQKQNKNYRRELQSYAEKIENKELLYQKLEKQVRENLDQVNLKRKQLSYVSGELEDNKRQIARLKKELTQIREINTKYENQLRILRQQIHKKSEYQSVQSGKRKLELQATKVELRRKNQQVQKMKQNYQQKIEGLETKVKELNQFITQKQLLAKITNSHMSQ